MMSNHPLTEPLSERIAKQIASEHIAPRSTTSIVIEQLGYASIVLVVLTVAVVAVNGISFWFRTSGLGDFAAYGTDGVQAIAESVPSGLVLSAIVGLIGGLIAIRHYDISYKQPIILLVSGIVLLTFGLGISLAQTGINEALAERADQDDLPLLQPLYQHRLEYRQAKTRAVVGPVMQIGQMRLIIGVGEQPIEVKTADDTEYPIGKPTVGDHVRVLLIKRAGQPIARVILLGTPRHPASLVPVQH
ncbi:hypothetical protein HY524_00985 [Candidatus Berkelbacteria bacterium]|nr:hypothetical protein [Candidatus Berkelbacteria bacterium]